MPMDRTKYPANWNELSAFVRLNRSLGRCECIGECGDVYSHGLLKRDAPGRCDAINGEPHPMTGSAVVLTAAHLCHDSSCDDVLHLKAMCQRCHLAYDKEQHAETRARNKDERRGQSRLPLEV